MTTTSPGRLLFKKIGRTQRWVTLSSLLGIIPIGSGIGLFAFALYLLTKSALFGTAASVSLTILGVRFSLLPASSAGIASATSGTWGPFEFSLV